MTVDATRITFDVCPSAKAASQPTHATHIGCGEGAIATSPFLSGLSQEVSKQLRATGVMTTLTDAVERAKLLMTIGYHSEAVAITTKQPSNNEFLQLQQQLTDLSEQVAALSFRRLGKPQSRVEVQRCFICNKVGHLQHACPARRPRQDTRRCFICNQPGHGWRNCQQGNERGMAVWGSSRPSHH